MPASWNASNTVSFHQLRCRNSTTFLLVGSSWATILSSAPRVAKTRGKLEKKASHAWTQEVSNETKVPDKRFRPVEAFKFNVRDELTFTV